MVSFLVLNFIVDTSTVQNILLFFPMFFSKIAYSLLLPHYVWGVFTFSFLAYVITLACSEVRALIQEANPVL